MSVLECIINIDIFIEICIILCTRHIVVTRVCEYECIEVYVCTASRKTDECNCVIGSVV